MDYTFHPTLVAPFYAHLMNANLLSMPAPERADFAAQFRETLPRYTTEELRQMLRSDWRPAKVAAWVIAARGDRSFLPDLEMRMARREYVEEVCIALATFGGETATKILQTYLRALLPPTGQSDPIDERINPDWALAALSRVAPQVAQSWLQPAGPWDQFLTTRHPILVAPWREKHHKAKMLLPQAVNWITQELR